MAENHDEILRAIGRLEGAMTEGFKAIHARQDVANGKLIKHDEKIDELESYRDQLKGRVAVIAGGVGFVGSLVVVWFKDRFLKS